MSSLTIPPGTDLCQLPAAMPPPGVVPNFVDPESLAPALIAVSAVMLTWSTIFIAARLWMNWRDLKLADYFAIIACVLNAAYTGLILSVARYSRHQWNVPICWYTATYLKLIFSFGMLLGPAIFFAKAAILLLYLQIFSANRTIRITVYILMVVLTLTYWTNSILEIAFACPRPGETWIDLLTSGNPGKIIYFGPVQGSLAVVIDIAIFILPLPVLWKLNMPLRRRIALCAVFFTALMGVIASVIALYGRIKLLGTPDLTWLETQLFICIIVENNVALVVCCVPAFKNMCKKHIAETRVWKAFISRIHRRRSGRRGDGRGGKDVEKDGNRHCGGPRLAQDYLNTENSKESTYENEVASEGNLKHFVSHGQGSGSYDASSYSSRVVHIHGGTKEENETPESANTGANGIVRNIDITQEVHPEHVV
ncbi:hypothetical protein T069G_02602 [Trichoderma breve]|uniref:Rhodopsin domain-containing protein n=1 Tax=Trichoderma breve TaxID=2034170 RepID=A0A9W9E792_9HYPO|nr:hypothetical protein T069G_02602 [Trichoderma breve]KAJ4861648.1 hypothetical protein T069G_02602 [Trichoderma breve]